MCMGTCGDLRCHTCGPRQGNNQCYICGAWDDEGGCDDPDACQASIDAIELTLATEATMAADWDKEQEKQFSLMAGGTDDANAYDPDELPF
jgi:hypothetical protein